MGLSELVEKNSVSILREHVSPLLSPLLSPLKNAFSDKRAISVSVVQTRQLHHL